jgi:hypothetical protein
MLAPLTLALLLQATPGQTYAANYKLLKTDLKAAGVTFEAPMKMLVPAAGADKLTIGKKTVSFTLYASNPAGSLDDLKLKYPFTPTVTVLRPSSPLAITATTRSEVSKALFDRLKLIFKQKSTAQLTKTLTQLTNEGTLTMDKSIGKADYYTAVINLKWVENGKTKNSQEALAFIIAVKPNTVLFASVTSNSGWPSAMPKKNGMNEKEYATAAGLILARFMKSLRFTKP